jgi:hypothetical protein
MPCYQPTNLPSGVTTTGRTGYATEADCNNACQEGACCEGTSCSVKPQCQCQGTGKTFKGVGTVCTPNPCDTSCKPCNGGTTASKATVTAVVDNIVLRASPTNPFTLEQLNGWLAGTYILDKTDIGASGLVYYQFGGYPVPTGSRSADMLYACSVAGDSFIDPQGGPVCTVSYRQPGFEIKLFCYPPQSTQRGNVCTGTEERAFGNIIGGSTNILAGTGRMTVS